MGEFVLWAHGMIGTLTYNIGVIKGYAYYPIGYNKTNKWFLDAFEEWTFQD
jgi:hypothetical protein